MKFPRLPQVPATFRGKTLVLLGGAFAGNAAHGEPWIRTCAPALASAVGNRDAQLYLFMAGATPTAEEATSVKSEVQRYRTALRPHARAGMWLNFMNGNGAGARARIKEADPGDAYQRLLALKLRYDPRDTFRFAFQLRD